MNNRPLTDMQRKFAVNIASGDFEADWEAAWQAGYLGLDLRAKPPSDSQAKLRSRASKLRKDPRIRALIGQLKQKRASRPARTLDQEIELYAAAAAVSVQIVKKLGSALISQYRAQRS